jgi:thiamine kinase-like enzyme
MEVAAITARVWPGRRVVVETLGGGITNHNLKVTVDGGEVFVLRVAGRDTGLLGIDRRAEHAASLAAAAVGVGPDVVDFLEDEGCLITRYIEGTPVPLERMVEPRSIGLVAHAVRAFHLGPPLPARFSSFQVVEDYRTTAFGRGAEMPPAYAWARQVARRIERARGPVPERPCHNDLLNANFIDDGDRIRIVDWEYAGMGDVFFDLANFAVNHELDEDQRSLLLEAYFGAARDQDVRALELMRFMSDFREAMWGVVQSAVSSLAFDFHAYAAEHFARLERTAVEPGFARALGD